MTSLEAPTCLTALARAWGVMESCLPIGWRHHLVPPGEWQLSALGRQAGMIRPQRGLPVVTQAEQRAFAACGWRPPPRLVAAEAWRDFTEDALDRWWHEAHGEHCLKDVRFELAQEHSFRGLPRIPRGGGAGEFLWAPVHSEDPLEARGVSREWVNAFFVWMHTNLLFRLPTRIFIECFARLVTAPHGCALFDLVPTVHRCAPQTYSCHAWDDDLFALVAANQQAPWLSFVAINLHAPELAAPSSLTARLGVCIAACEGVVVCLPGKGEPMAALRPLLRSWCLVEICSAPTLNEHNTDPYATARSMVPLRFALGGVDDDVERHRAIADAIRTLSSAAAAADDAEEDTELKQLLRDAHGSHATVDTKLRELVRKAFFEHYCEARHAHIQQLYAYGA